MSPDPARRTADLMLAVAAGVALYAALRRPEPRRTLLRALARTITVTLPGFLAHQVREAWASSAPVSVRE